jgi:hypothetical protein
VVNVRADGIAVVLGPLLSDARITAAALVDVDSGLVLDAWSAVAPAGAAPDLELIGAQHAEIVRNALTLLRTWPDADGPEADPCEVVLGADGGCRHLLRTVPDPHGDRLALAVVVDGPPRVLERVRKRLRSISVDALTAGPSMIRRPVLGGWSFAMPKPDVPASPERPMVRPPEPGPPVPHGVAPMDGALRDLVAVETGQSGPDGSARPDGVRGSGDSLAADAVKIAMPQIPMPPIAMPQIPMPGPRDARTAPERPTPAAASRPAAEPPAARSGPSGPRPPSPPAALPARAPSRPPHS